MDDDAAPLRLNNADRHPNPMSPPINPLHQDVVDDGVGWDWRVRFRRMSTTFDHQEFPSASETLWLAIQLSPPQLGGLQGTTGYVGSTSGVPPDKPPSCAATKLDSLGSN
jgi:hypothetical protein